MKSFNNELIIHRGETFTMDKTIQNKDGSPYIISSELENPFFVITVASTRYQQEGRYTHVKWLDLKDFPRFKVTQAVDLKSLKTEKNGNNSHYPNGFDDIVSLSEYADEDTGIVYSNLVAWGFIEDKFIGYEVGDALFYVEDEDGIISYKYWDDGWKTYECKIVTSYGQATTLNWVEQSYVYSINLASGTKTIDYLRELCDDNNLSYLLTNTAEDLYNILIEAEIKLPNDFIVQRPIVKPYETFVPILTPTKLSVLSEL